MYIKSPFRSKLCLAEQIKYASSHASATNFGQEESLARDVHLAPCSLKHADDANLIAFPSFRPRAKRNQVYVSTVKEFKEMLFLHNLEKVGASGPVELQPSQSSPWAENTLRHEIEHAQAAKLLGLNILFGLSYTKGNDGSTLFTTPHIRVFHPLRTLSALEYSAIIAHPETPSAGDMRSLYRLRGCLDLNCLAGAIEQAGLNPLLIPQKATVYQN